MTPTATTRRTSPLAAWTSIVAGLVLVVMAVGLAALFYVILPPNPQLPRFVPFLLADLGLLGAVSLAGGLQARRTGGMSPIIRGAVLVLAFGLIGVFFAMR